MANNKEKTVTLTVAECSEFHNMGEFYEGIMNVADAIEKFRSIPPKRMNGIPAIGVRMTGQDDPGDIVEMDVLIGNRFDLDMLQYVPDLAENWQVQQMIAGLIHKLPNMEIDGEKDTDGNLLPDTICIRFKHPEINNRLAKFAKAKK